METNQDLLGEITKMQNFCFALGKDLLQEVEDLISDFVKYYCYGISGVFFVEPLSSLRNWLSKDRMNWVFSYEGVGNYQIRSFESFLFSRWTEHQLAFIYELDFGVFTTSLLMVHPKDEHLRESLVRDFFTSLLYASFGEVTAASHRVSFEPKSVSLIRDTRGDGEISKKLHSRLFLLAKKVFYARTCLNGSRLSLKTLKKVGT